MNIIDLSDKLKTTKKQKEKMKKKKQCVDLDKKASFICLKTCLDYININDLPELQEVKISIVNAMVRLKRND